MPLKIPPVRPCYTARSKHGAENLRYLREKTSLNEAVNGFKPFRWDKVSAMIFCTIANSNFLQMEYFYNSELYIIFKLFLSKKIVIFSK